MWLKNSSVLLGYRRQYVRTSSFKYLSTGCEESNSDVSSSEICEAPNKICPCNLAVLWYAEGHSSCVEYRTNSSTYQFESVHSRYDLNLTIDGKSSGYRSITNMCTPGTFDIQFRWASGHSPYPRISKMTIVVFGTMVRNDETMSCACEDNTDASWETVARVTIFNDKSYIVEKVGGSGSGDSDSGQSDSGNLEEDDIQ